MSVRIIIDDAADAPQELIEAHGIYVVPINVAFGTEEYQTGITIDRPGFYKRVKRVTAGSFPKTSQPTPFQFEEVLRTALAEGATELIAVTVSDKLSGTYASAMAAAEALRGQVRVHVFDSRSGSAAQGLMAVVAARLAEQGAPAARILEALAEMRRHATIYLLIDSLEFAVRGGRVSSLQSGVASLLNIKPVMTVEDGLIVPSGRVRTMGKALQRIVEETRAAVGDRPVLLAAVHANTADAGARLLEMARPHFNVVEDYLLELALSVAVNLGPGALGLVTVPLPSQVLAH
jgi:DegV family protein with EDD domain